MKVIEVSSGILISYGYSYKNCEFIKDVCHKEHQFLYFRIVYRYFKKDPVE